MSGQSMEYTKAFDFDLDAIEDAGIFEGYASVFGGPPDYQGDIVKRGAFAETIAESKGKVPILMGHAMGRIVGFGIDAEEDNKGLRVVGQFTLESDEGKNAYALCRHASKCGHKLGLSIGYAIRPDGAIFNDKTRTRTLTALDLFEYSIAATPAAPRARVARVKSYTSLREAERYLRDLGMTHDEARELISFIKAERDVTPNHHSAPERDVKEHYRRDADDFLSKLRGCSFQSQLKELTI